jgi:hypothetical protein
MSLIDLSFEYDRDNNQTRTFLFDISLISDKTGQPMAYYFMILTSIHDDIIKSSIIFDHLTSF